MIKPMNLFSMLVVLCLVSFLSIPKVYADILPSQGEILITNSIYVLIGIVGIGLIVLISWLVIRAIKRKKK